MKTVFKLAAVAVVVLALPVMAVARDAGDDGWHRYSSFSLSFPFVNHEFECDDADCEFNSNGIGFDYSAHHVSPSGFTILSRYGFAYITGDLDVDYGTWWDDEDEQWDSDEGEIEDFKGFFTYFKLGVGYAFQLLDRHLAIIPTAGVGFTMDLLYCEYDTYEEDEYYYYGSYYTDYYEYSDDYFGVDFTIDFFFNVMASFMFTNHFGLSASCEVSMNMLGFGASSELEDTYSTDFGKFSFMPAVGICLRF